jgi:phage pi2 protein 07
VKYYTDAHTVLDIPDDMILITKKEYDELCKDQAILEALRAGGVDNWEGYDWALEDFDWDAYEEETDNV